MVIHGVSCEQGISDILAEARGFRFRGGRFRGRQHTNGARWLVGWHRRLGKFQSSVVVFFNTEVCLEKAEWFFWGRMCPVDVYEFDQGRFSSR